MDGKRREGSKVKKEEKAIMSYFLYLCVATAALFPVPVELVPSPKSHLMNNQSEVKVSKITAK